MSNGGRTNRSRLSDHGLLQGAFSDTGAELVKRSIPTAARENSLVGYKTVNWGLNMARKEIDR
eukprot:1924100-Pyramimonas_sp.AAC.1